MGGRIEIISHGLHNAIVRFTWRGWDAGVFVPFCFFVLGCLQKNWCVRISTNFSVPSGRTPDGNLNIRYAIIVAQKGLL